MTETTPSNDLERTAQDALLWYVLLTSGHATDEDFSDHAQWLAQDPLHLEAFDRIQVQAAGIAAASVAAKARFASDRLAAVVPLTPRPVRRLRRLAIPAAIAAGLALFVLLPRITGESGREHLYETASAGTRQFRLDDGSVVYLDHGSRLGVSYTDGARTTRLERGRALFDVVHKLDQPFSVAAGGHVIRVLGTRFEVASQGHELSVAVSRGAVSVADASGSDAAVVRAGEKLTYGAHPQAVRQSVDQADVGGWASGRLTFDHEPLEKVIARVNAYVTDGQLKVIDRNLAARPFTGVIVIGDARTTATRLAGLMQLTYSSEGNVITLAPR